jgi:hypothetical protein
MHSRPQPGEIEHNSQFFIDPEFTSAQLWEAFSRVMAEYLSDDVPE